MSVRLSSISLILWVCFWLGCGERPFRYDPDQAVYIGFSGAEALKHAEKLVGFGPRPAGSEALEASRGYLERALASYGWTVIRQPFEEKTPKGNIAFVNLIARFGDESKPPTILLGSHYDSKLYEDFEFVGANDGASSTGALLEIARVTSSHPALARALELVFFDGEEAFLTSINETDGLYGSRFYAKQLRTKDITTFPKYGIILDMIGDKNLNVEVPADSPDALYSALRRAAEDLGAGSYFDRRDTLILDDHVPLNAIGIPTIDIIDLDYAPFWHTKEDTLDKISAESLQTVGKTTLLMIEKYLLK